MNQETLDIIDSVAWPIAAALIVLILRESIGTVIVMLFMGFLSLIGIEITRSKE